jgi:uncharacterized delta-60 repeat protein
MNRNILHTVRIAALCVLTALHACGGGGGNESSTPPATTGLIGAAGGTVTGPNGAKVEIPAGALATDVTIQIEQTTAGAPALPTDLAAQGPMFAFTPHGTTFALPVTMTMPFDPALVPAGTTPQFYKTNAQNEWEQVANATFGTNSVIAEITSFSSAQVVIPPLQRNEPEREWDFSVYPRSGSARVTLPAPDQGGSQTGGFVADLVEFGAGFGGKDMVIEDQTLLYQGQARGFAFATPDGVTYGVYSESPDGGGTSGVDPIGSRSKFKQLQSYIKRAADAKLFFTVTRAEIEIRDYQPPPNPARPDLRIKGELQLSIAAYTTTQAFFFQAAGVASVTGAHNVFTPSAENESFATRPLWSVAEHFDFTSKPSFYDLGTGNERETTTGCPGTRAFMKLKKPIVMQVDLSKINVGQEFTVRTDTYADTNNRRAFTKLDCLGSSAIAYLKDPAGVSGTSITISGLEPTNRPLPSPQQQLLLPPAACVPGPGPNADAGVLQFSAASYSVGEFAGAPSTITVTRTGGSRGAVTAILGTSDGTGAVSTTSTPAVAGVDYEAVNSTVFFGDGDTAPRKVTVPTIQNQVRAPNKVLNLTLSQPGGCAALGAQSTAVLTILDDGGFTLPPPPSGLDTSFGTAGKATLELFGGDRSSMALQPDGKIVMVGGTLQDFILARFNADGSVDRTFGPAGDGKVTTDMGSGFIVEEATAVAVQADGKIVVVGYTAIDNAPPTPDGPPTFAIARYNIDGSLDTGFGTGGRVSGNVNGRARAVAIQPDGKLVLAGEFSFPTPNGSDFSDLTVARFNTDGSLDLPFGWSGTGQLTTDIDGLANSGSNIVLQPNGAIVISGKLQCSAPECNHTNVVRYNANGTLDASFGSAGKRTLPGVDVAQGLALQAGGKLVLVGSVAVGTGTTASRDFVLMRLNADGSTDTTFGSLGTTITAISSEVDRAQAIALQADGKIVVVGSTSNINTNFAIARYTSDGTLDPNFGNGFGFLTLDFFRFTDFAESVLVQPDGKILLGGLAQNNLGRNGYGLARFIP